MVKEVWRREVERRVIRLFVGLLILGLVGPGAVFAQNRGSDVANSLLTSDNPADPARAEVVPGRVVIRLSGAQTAQSLGRSLKAKQIPVGSRLTQALRSDPRLSGASLRPLYEPSKRAAMSPAGITSRDSVLSRWSVIEYNQHDAPAEVCGRLTAQAGGEIDYCGPDHVVRLFSPPNDTYADPTSSGNWTAGAWGQSFPNLWGLEKMRVLEAWNAPGCAGNCRGEGIIVAVLDTGVDYNHPDIAQNIWRNPLDNSYGANFVVPGSSDPMDDHGHGTHVAGTIAALADNNSGIAGVAPRATIMPVKVLGADGAGSLIGIAQGIQFAAEHGAKVINMSLGAQLPEVPEYLKDALALAHDTYGVTIVAAAGNSKSWVGDGSIGFSPANDTRVIAVAASDSTDRRASFSNWGAKIDVAAPGGGDSLPVGVIDPSRSILSLKSSIVSPGMTGAEKSGAPVLVVGDSYLRQAGTSMAAPHVAGLAALILARYPNLRPEQVRQAIRKGAADIGSPGFDFGTGYGRLNALNSLAFSEPLEVRLASSQIVAKLVSTVTIRGTVQGSNLAQWHLDYGSGESPTSWTPIASGSTPFSQSSIIEWDVGSMPDGMYAVRLSAQDQGGQIYEDRAVVLVSQVVITSPDGRRRSLYRSSVPIEGIVMSDNFVSYSIKIYRGFNADELIEIPDARVVLVNGGLSRVESGKLGEWDATGVPAGHYTAELNVTLTDGTVVSKRVAFGVDATLHQGYPRALGGLGAYADAIDDLTVADVDGDGKKEIITLRNNQLNVLNHSGDQLPGWPQPVPGYAFTAPLVATNGVGGGLNIIATTTIATTTVDRAGKVFVFDRTGQLQTSWLSGSLSSNLKAGISDINGDGTEELLVGGWRSASDTFFGVFNGFGEPTTTGWPLFLPSQNTPCVAKPAIGDVNGDGRPEMVVLVADGAGGLSQPYYEPRQTSDQVYLFDAEGQVMPGWPKTHQAQYDGCGAPPALADLDGDGFREVLVGTRTGQVLAYHADGAAVSGWPQPQAALGQEIVGFAVGDLDGDKKPEVVASVAGYANVTGREETLLYAWRADGTLLNNWPKSGGSFDTIFQSPILADLDGDGKADIAVPGRQTYSGQSIHGYRFDGATIPSFPKVLGISGYGWSGAQNSGAAVDDFDGDGRLDLAWLDNSSTLFMWDLWSSAGCPQPWPMVNYDAQGSRTLSTAATEPSPGACVSFAPTPTATPTETPTATATSTPTAVATATATPEVATTGGRQEGISKKGDSRKLNVDIWPTSGRPGSVVVVRPVTRSLRSFSSKSQVYFARGARAKVTYVSKNMLRVEVPLRARSGTVFVKTPSKPSLGSRVVFRVTGSKGLSEPARN